jgi:hypothetical protein
MSQDAQPAHVIRIHSTWFRTELAVDGAVLRAQRVSLPDSTSLLPDTNTVVFVRNFNLPTGLSSSDRIELECELLPVAHLAKINQVELMSPRSAVITITPWLKKHNEIEIHLAKSDFEAAKSASARLRILSS